MNGYNESKQFGTFDCMCVVTNFIYVVFASMLFRFSISCLCEALPSMLQCVDGCEATGKTQAFRSQKEKNIVLKMVARAARFYFNTFTVVIESPSAGIAFFLVVRSCRQWCTASIFCAFVWFVWCLCWTAVHWANASKPLHRCRQNSRHGMWPSQRYKRIYFEWQQKEK